MAKRMRKLRKRKKSEGFEDCISGGGDSDNELDDND